MESSLAIANYFIQKSIDTGNTISPMKLVKLVYISHGWYLGLADKPLISDEVQAWKYGPVIPPVYQQFKKYGDSPITEKAYYRNQEKLYYYSLNDPLVASFLDKVWEVYSNYSGIQLSSLTHEPNTPWDIIWNKYNGSTFYGASIPNNIIKEHYKAMIDGDTTRK